MVFRVTVIVQHGYQTLQSQGLGFTDVKPLLLRLLLVVPQHGESALL